MDYLSAKPRIRSGDLIEFGGRSVLARCIQRVTGNPVNHSAIIVRATVCREQHNFLYEADSAGFHPAHLSSRIADHKGLVLWYPLSPLLSFVQDSIAKNILALEGRPYDWASLLLNAFHRQKLNADKLYCSEAIQYGVRTCLAEIVSPNKPWAYQMLRRLDNGGYGLFPGELGLTRVWMPPIEITH